MPSSDQPPQHSSDPESAYRSYLQANAMPAIGAADAGRLRQVLTDIARHLCHHLRRDLSQCLSPGLGSPMSWGICQAGSATRAGFQLYEHVSKVIAAGCLHAIGLDPHQAAADESYLATTLEPALAAASRPQLQNLLLELIEHIQVSMDDADTAAGWSQALVLPAGAWEAGTGVRPAIGLYQHATLVQGAHVLHHLWEGLGTSKPASLQPFNPGTPSGWPAGFSAN